MLNSIRRISVFHKHLLHTRASLCGSTSVLPSLTISPSTCLIDEKIDIQVNGLAANQLVTLTSRVEEGGNKKEARAVFRASQDGTVNNSSDPSIAGTYKDVDQMGLFWSLQATPGQKLGLRLTKKDVTTPMDFEIKLYDGEHAGDSEINDNPLTTAVVHRYYKHPSVRRIPITEGPYRGTIFLPEGDGPFPGVIDTFGGLVSLIETRAALLASRGYATFALSYLYQGHLAKTIMAADPNYFKDAVDWFSGHDYIDENRLGAVGLCYGGCLSLYCASILPKLRVVVSINGLTIMPGGVPNVDENGRPLVPLVDSSGKQWPDPDAVYLTDEGIVIRDIYGAPELVCIPAWQHGAKILIISGEDDKQVHPKWHQYFLDRVPAGYHGNVELVSYPGAGHLIEPPYSPLCRNVNPGPARMATVDFVKEEFRGHLFMSGGFPEQHAYAQEDAWRRILEFLKREL